MADEAVNLMWLTAGDRAVVFLRRVTLGCVVISAIATVLAFAARDCADEQRARHRAPDRFDAWAG